MFFLLLSHTKKWLEHFSFWWNEDCVHDLRKNTYEKKCYWLNVMFVCDQHENEKYKQPYIYQQYNDKCLNVRLQMNKRSYRLQNRKNRCPFSHCLSSTSLKIRWRKSVLLLTYNLCYRFRLKLCIYVQNEKRWQPVNWDWETMQKKRKQ